MKVADLKLLYDDILVPCQLGKKPRLEAELVTALMKHLLPDVIPAAVEEAILSRGRVASPGVPVADTLLLKNASMFELAMEEQEDEEARQELQRIRDKADTARRKVLKLKAQVDTMEVSAAAPASSAGAPGPTQQCLVRVSDSGCSQEEAKAWAPLRCTVTKELRLLMYARWQVISSQLRGT